MANAIRGEIESDIFGEPMVFCLTLGALAEIESKLDVASLPDMLQHLARGAMSARDCLVILGAAARAGGIHLDNDALAMKPLTGGFERALHLVNDLLLSCFDDDHTPRDHA